MLKYLLLLLYVLKLTLSLCIVFSSFFFVFCILLLLYDLLTFAFSSFSYLSIMTMDDLEIGDHILRGLTRYLEPLLTNFDSIQQRLFKVESRLGLLSQEFNSFQEVVEKIEDKVMKTWDMVTLNQFNMEKGFSKLYKLARRNQMDNIETLQHW